MTDLERLDPLAAAAALRAAPDGARGFLGVDPVTQNDMLVALELTRLGAQVFRRGQALLGFVPNSEQPRQATVATTSADPHLMAEFLTFLGSYQRCTSYVGMVPSGGVAESAFSGCGFHRSGTLRGHRYQAGQYHDVQVYFATVEDLCRS
jgi:hypothetical protein